MKKLLKIIGIILGMLLLAALMLFAIVTRVPTGQDAELSAKIRDEFVGMAVTNLPSNSLDVRWSARRGITILFVHGVLSEDEKRKMESLAQQASHQNRDRKIILEFK